MVPNWNPHLPELIQSRSLSYLGLAKYQKALDDIDTCLKLPQRHFEGKLYRIRSEIDLAMGKKDLAALDQSKVHEESSIRF